MCQKLKYTFYGDNVSVHANPQVFYEKLGRTPLHVAAEGNHYNTCEVLLRAGISKDARTKVDKTPLHFAAFEGHVQIVQLLLKHCCDVNAKDMVCRLTLSGLCIH